MKKNSYLEMKERHRHAINNFPISFAFNREQFQEGMEKLGLKPDETDKVINIGGGGFIRKTDTEAFVQLNANMAKEFLDLVKKDTTGEGFVCEMFEYELSNHEYCITYDIEPTLRALGLSKEDLESNPILQKGLALAKSNYWQASYET